MVAGKRERKSRADRGLNATAGEGGVVVWYGMAMEDRRLCEVRPCREIQVRAARWHWCGLVRGKARKSSTANLSAGCTAREWLRCRLVALDKKEERPGAWLFFLDTYACSRGGRGGGGEKQRTTGKQGNGPTRKVAGGKRGGRSSAEADRQKKRGRDGVNVDVDGWMDGVDGWWAVGRDAAEQR